MENGNDLETHSISSNSLSHSNSDETNIVPIVAQKTKANKKKKFTKSYPVRHARVPRRCFHRVYRKVMDGTSVIELKSQSDEKANCNRFILHQINGNNNQLENISPESITRLMAEMKNCVQRKEFGDLAKLISMFTEMPLGKARWYPTLIRYCLIALLYDPLVQGSGLLELFLEGVVGCRNETDKKAFLQDVNRLPKNIHVTKYDDLWKINDNVAEHQLNERSVDELCKTLNNQLGIRDGEKRISDDNSDWESYDENDSTEDDEDGDNETTEIENPFDLEDVITELEKKYFKK